MSMRDETGVMYSHTSFYRVVDSSRASPDRHHGRIISHHNHPSAAVEGEEGWGRRRRRRRFFFLSFLFSFVGRSSVDAIDGKVDDEGPTFFFLCNVDGDDDGD